MTNIREIQRPLRERYAEDPAAARYTYNVHVVDADLDDPMHAVARSGSHPGPDYRVSVNEKIGGSGGEPTPGDVLLAALATCKAMSIKMVANALRIQLAALAVEIEGELDHRGVLMMPGGARPGFEAIRCAVRVTVAPGTSPELVHKLEAACELCCAVTDTIRNATPLATTFAVRS